jgi:hypothetical protein
MFDNDTFEQIINHIEKAISRPHGSIKWITETGEEETTDVGYAIEGIELMKDELIRVFRKK